MRYHPLFRVRGQRPSGSRSEKSDASAWSATEAKRVRPIGRETFSRPSRHAVRAELASHVPSRASRWIRPGPRPSAVPSKASPTGVWSGGLAHRESRQKLIGGGAPQCKRTLQASQGSARCEQGTVPQGGNQCFGALPHANRVFIPCGFHCSSHQLGT